MQSGVLRLTASEHRVNYQLYHHHHKHYYHRQHIYGSSQVISSFERAAITFIPELFQMVIIPSYLHEYDYVAGNEEHERDDVEGESLQFGKNY